MKKLVSLTLALLLVLTVFEGLSLAVAENVKAGKAEPKRFGIIGAMDEEIASLTEAMTEPQIRAVAGMDFYEGTLDGVDVVIVKCGVGKVNAASCAQILIDLFGVDRIINTGVAGSLDARIDIGDIVVSTEAV